MKNKIRSIIAGLIAVIFLLSPVQCLAQSGDASSDGRARDLLSGIFNYHEVDDAQTWIDGYLVNNIDSGVEWYAFALAQSGNYDFSGYEDALVRYLAGKTVGSASSRLKYALCLASIGSTDSYILKTIDDAIGKQGLMSWVFGLHLLNNGYECNAYSSSDVIEKILELQCTDGGWAISGQQGDVDATAMTVQALALHYETDANVSAAIDNALGFLSEKQLADGDYSSYGTPNPESTAQVLVALSSLKIDAATDERFIKNGNSVFDGIEKYKSENGGFSHEDGGDISAVSTMQVFYAAVSYLRFISGKAPLYILDNADPEHAESAPSADSDNNMAETSGYKWWVSLIIVGIGGVWCIMLAVFKKRHVKNFVAVLLVCALSITAVMVTNIQSADDYYNTESFVKENVIGKVTLTIRCDTVAGRAEHIPESGIILDVTEFEIADGDSVYTILTEAARKHKIQLESNGSGIYAYIAGIAYLYEFDYGDLSGWTYKVNGVSPSVGIGSYKLKNGDALELHYTTNLGQDVK